MVENSHLETDNYTKLLHNLTDLANQGLHDMFIEEELDFAFKKKLVDNKIVLEDRNTRYTLINLIGLHKAKSNGFIVTIDLEKVLEREINNIHSYQGVGEIGLLLWASSLIKYEAIEKIITKINFQNILNNYSDAKGNLTMELSWLLTGTLMASTFNTPFSKSFNFINHQLYKLVRNNYYGYGIFAHQGIDSFSGMLRGDIGSFADQVYPIYAFVLYSKIYDMEEPLLVAKECAEHLCKVQGDNGEWMWHYNSRDGEVISKYPVYSVHQDAMAPMALFAVQKATDIDFDIPIKKGLDWLTNNSRDENIINFEHNAVWRCITPSKSQRKIKSVFSQFGFNTSDEFNNLSVLKECWSYHLGWILHAFSGRLNHFEKNSEIPQEEKNSVDKN